MIYADRFAVPRAQQSAPADPSTRERVLRRVSEAGPVTATSLCEELGLTDTAIRRHIDGLLADGLIESREVRPTGRRRRGRPARGWVVSSAGHASLSADYDDLASEALRFIEDTAGSQGVAQFAERRAAQVERRYAAELAEVGHDPRERAVALVESLTRDGYAASTRPVAGEPGEIGVQLCQGHCPVQHVAAEFPQFCEAETEAFSRLLGVHVQRLSTLAQGAHVCTTFVPTGQLAGSPPATTNPSEGRTHDSID